MENDTEQWRRLGISACALAAGPAEKRTWATVSEWLYKDDAIVMVDMNEVRTAADTVDRLQARIATLEALVREAQPVVPDSIMREWQRRAAAALGDNDGR